MGSVNSRPPGECSDEVLASLSPKNQRKLNQLSYPNFFEGASLTTDPNTPAQKRGTSISQSIKNKDRRKWPATSEDSHMSNMTPITPPAESSNRVMHLNNSPYCNSKIEFEMISGRRYQSSPGAHFYLPCDDDEADRLVIMHFLIKYAFNGNVVAPVIPNLQAKLQRNQSYQPKVLDVGCGPGTWILEMATEFPHSEFHGIDLRTMFPSTIKPQNTHFLQHDFFQGLPYADSSFEFVRMRSMLGFITQKQLLFLLSEIQRVLKPLGYIELLDVEYQIHRPGPICESILNQQLQSTMQKKGIDFLASHHLSTLLMTQPADGGFIDVHQHRVTIPIGWGGQLGEVHAQNLCSFLQSIHPTIKNYMNQNGPQGAGIDTLIADAVKECTTMQSHMNWFVCYGQKPANNVFTVTPPPSVKNMIPNEYPPSMITPLPSPNASSIDLKQYQQNENTWDSINDFVDGYID
ncbi:hypothetical protein HPULCUR_008897 [Helicostylum pulchrum]|uniref:Methyltransferase domain-containing protein n=1 Tax=Helicostylum pulchrum TaxID=562976 RepID=A0ABP9Y8X2_9FUNG